MRAVKFRELVAKNRLFREAAPATSCGQLSTHTRNTLRGPRGQVPIEMRERGREKAWSSGTENCELRPRFAFARDAWATDVCY